MHFIGIDLAWGERRPTGVAVLDDSGTLLHVSAHLTDEAILTALAPYAEGSCVVAVDAPLVVRNATGNRPGEAALNRDFARFDAGAHPVNTGKPEFAEVPRGARLAAALDLDLDPHSFADRRAIEVFPHPATVALFRLGRTLKYKNRTGRSLEQLRADLLRLTELLDGLADHEPPLRLERSAQWRALVADIGEAKRKSDLRRVEDQVDAVLCAYIALYAVRRPEDTTIYGDAETGAIVTPTLPAGHVPTPRPKRTPADAGQAHAARVRDAVRAYAATYAEVERTTERYVALVTSLLDDAGINYLTVSGRAKSLVSFAAKAARTSEGRALFEDPLTQITDQIGLRIITYLREDVDAAAQLLGEHLDVLDDRDLGQETASQGRFGYASRHLLVTVDAERSSTYAEMAGRRAQVQVRTVLQHAWAEFEHAIRYKGTIPEEHASDLDRRFTLAAGLLDLADREFSLIQERLQASTRAPGTALSDADASLAAQELANFLATVHPEAGWSRQDHYEWIAGLLRELGITSLVELGGLLSAVDADGLNERMGYRRPPTAVRRLDDALLWLFRERYLALSGNAHREPLLRTRLEKLLSSPVEPTG